MADKTGIEWTDATWNAVTGCDKVSDGCLNCYAETLALRLQRMGNAKYANGFDVTLHEKALTIPLKWREPRRVFVNSMSDQWHVDVPAEFTDRMFAVMALTPHHTYQILTKRPQRAANYLNDPQTLHRILNAGSAFWPLVKERNYPPGIVRRTDEGVPILWPLPNVWIGTSVEDSRVTHRIDALRRCPAAVRFLSCEPLIGPLPDLNLDGIHWVIAGGESGIGHRPVRPEWVRDLRDQCESAGVAFFFKQWGGHTPKAGGKELDGREWCEFPAVSA
jgi:protein gp37